MAQVVPSKQKGHLAVAALRVTANRENRPARPDEIATLLGWGLEETLVVMRGLVDCGVARMHETPFEVHFELLDHLKLEELPEEGEEPELDEEVAEFHRRNKTRREELERMFREGEADQRRKKKVEELEQQFSEFRKKKRPPIE